jgi:hypothetical protein
MANPITPNGNRRNSGDIFDAARRQDEERQIREDNQYFEQTGINRPPRETYDPLVDNNTQDVARDGDSYDDQPFRNPIVENYYSEDAPSQIIDNGPRGRANSSRQNFERQRSLLSEAINTSMAREGINPNIPARPASTNARQAYLERQKVIENKVSAEEERKFKEKAEENKKKFGNSIMGLDI